jgi:hypothetical protein
MIKDRPLLRDMLFFSVMATVVFVLWRNNILVGSILFVQFLIAMVFFYQRSERIFFLITGFFGLVLEIIGAWFGIWTYTLPNLVTVPFWIFFSWGFTFALFHQLYLRFAKT